MGQFDHIVAAIQESRLTVDLMKMAESGDFSSLESEAKRHHFVSQFVLRQFARPAGGAYVYQVEKSGRRAPVRVAIDAAASRRRLYAIRTEEGGLSNRHEGYFALVESHAAPASTASSLIPIASQRAIARPSRSSSHSRRSEHLLPRSRSSCLRLPR